MQLSKVVSAILNDLSTAQDLANEYSIQLSRKYKKSTNLEQDDNFLSAFQVPAARLEEITLDLKFLIQDIDPHGFTLNFDKTQNNCDRLARQAVRRLFSFRSEITDLLQSRSPQSNSGLDALIDDPDNSDESTIKVFTPEFGEQLETKVTQDLFRLCHRTFLLGNTLTKPEAQDAIAEGLKDGLTHHPDIQHLLEMSDFDGRSDDSIESSRSDQFEDRLLISDNLEGSSEIDEFNRQDGIYESNDLRQRLNRYCSDCSEKTVNKTELESVIQKIEGNPNTSIIVRSETLRKAPAEIIQALQLKAKFDGYKWMLAEAGHNLTKI